MKKTALVAMACVGVLAAGGCKTQPDLEEIVGALTNAFALATNVTNVVETRPGAPVEVLTVVTNGPAVAVTNAPSAVVTNAPAPVASEPVRVKFRSALAGVRVRQKCYDKPHAGRYLGIKLGTEFYDKYGCRGDNTRVLVNGWELRYVQIDTDSGHRDLCYYSFSHKPAEFAPTVRICVYKNRELLACVRTASPWPARTTELKVPAEVEVEQGWMEL